jgi:hypothetical protein
MKQSAQFTFPAHLRAETKKEEVCEQLPKLFELIFLQRPDRLWLRAEFFDPAGLVSKYFISSPRQFFTLAAEALDPEGETDIAKWRQT